MITVREPTIQDEAAFLAAVKKSVGLHHPWVKAPLTSDEFHAYIKRLEQDNQKSFLVLKNNHIAGVFNINEIVRGLFQNAFLGFYAIAGYEGQKIMSSGLKLVLKYCFEELKLHRLEANIQPANINSIKLVERNKFRYEGFSPRYLKINDAWCGHEHWAITYEEYIQDNIESTQKDHIDIIAYNPKWPALAQSEIMKIRSLIPADLIVDIQHVGSTAIQGLSAKPIIDIQIAVNSLAMAKIVAVPLLQKLDYEYWADNPDNTRLFFAKGMPPYGEKRTHHVHIVEPTSPHWTGKIAFRDYLISHPDIAKEYELLKKDLASQHKYDREKYTDEKADFIKKILQRIFK